MTLGGLHLGPASIELVLVLPLLGALFRTAPWSFAVRRHRSSNQSKLAFSPAYHVVTG